MQTFVYQTTMLSIFLVGLLAGLFLKALRDSMGKVSAAILRQQQENDTLSKQEEQPIHIEDKRITCPSCWEEKHPNLTWPWYHIKSWITPCSQHKDECLDQVEEDEKDYPIYALAS